MKGLLFERQPDEDSQNAPYMMTPTGSVYDIHIREGAQQKRNLV